MEKKTVRSQRQACSKRSFLVHGQYWTPKWDFSHHVVPPITSSSTYRLESSERGAQGFAGFAAKDRAISRPEILIYERLHEPTRGMLEERLAFAEDGETGLCFSTGMAAISAAIGILVKQGEEIIAHKTLYGCTYSLLTNWLPRYGIKVKYVDMTDLKTLRKAIGPKTRVLYFETPVNPTMTLIDIKAVSEIAKSVKNVVTIVDNTFATPFCQRPLTLGADLVVHSLTKNICGFGTDMGGVVVTRKEFESNLLLYRKDFGGVLSSKNAWPILVYGLPSLELRAREEEKTATEIARFLEGHPKVRSVSYPGLDSFPQAELARRQMLNYSGEFSPGNLIYFTMEPSAADRFINHIASKAYCITLAVSLGQIRTLIEQPGSMTHATIPKEAQRIGGIDRGGIRLAVGIEDPNDIIADLKGALKNA